MTAKRQPSLFLPHGAGPSFFMNFGPFTPAMWTRACAYLQTVKAELPERPRALLVVSGHWETEVPTINVAPMHSLYYDYYGAPPEAYKITYPAPGAPEVGARVAQLLNAKNIPAAVETRRGLDHGVFLVCMLAFPEADIPVVQLSLTRDPDAAAHIAIGQALEPLREEGVVIIGSGMTFHNSVVMPAGLKGIKDPGSDYFDAWVIDAVTAPDSEQRNQALARWEQAPYARHAHPSPEHFLPLHIAAGAAGADRGRHVFSDRFLGATYSAFHFG